jgi:hypothetical protein
LAQETVTRKTHHHREAQKRNSVQNLMFHEASKGND